MNKQSGLLGLVLAGVCAVSGCSSTSPESVGTTEEAVGTECANAAQSVSFEKGISFVSARSYSTTSCYKAVALDVMNYTGNIGINSGALSTVVSWGDDAPALADCADAWVHSDLFVETSFQRWTFIGSQSASGAVSGTRCVVPALAWGAQMQEGESYRLSATARTKNASSAATRKVSVQTTINGAPDKCLDQNLQDCRSCTRDSCDPRTGVVTHANQPPGTACGGNGEGRCGSEGNCLFPFGTGSGGCGPG